MSTNPTDNNSGSDEPFFKGETPKLFAPQFHPSPKDGFEKVLEERIKEIERVINATNGFKLSEQLAMTKECKEILSEYRKHISVPSPKEISEEEIEGLFLAKYGNKITASDSWVIRFALDCVRKSSLPSSGSKTEESYPFEFVEWAHDKNWRFNVWNDRKWHNTANTHFSTTETKELFELFLKDKQQ